jgi:Polyketide cyclase / dehydrase and lipid transport
MGQRVAVSAIHHYLTAGEAYAVLRDFERHERVTDVVRSVRLARTEDGGQISFWEVQLQQAVLRWSQYDEPDDVNRRVWFQRREGDPVDFRGVWSAVEEAEGCRIALDCEFRRPLAPRIARMVRRGVAIQLEGIFGPGLWVESGEPATTAGI